MGEVPKGGRDVVEAVDDLEVFVAGGETARDATLPAVDQGKGGDPGCRRRPGRHEQGPPGQSGDEDGAVHDTGCRHDQSRRSAGTDVWVPSGKHRWPLDEQSVAGVLDVPSDQDGRRNEESGGQGCVQIAEEGAGHLRTLGRAARKIRPSGPHVSVSA